MSQSQQGRPVKIIVALSVLGVVVLGCALMWSQSSLGKASSELKDELKRASADGMAIEPDDIRRQLVVPSGANAAPFLVDAFGDLKKWGDSKDGKEFSKNLKPLRQQEPLTPSQMAEVRLEVQSANGILAKFKQAARYSRLDFNRAWEKGPALLLPEYASAKLGCSLLLAQARLQLEDGQVESALDSMDVAARLSKLIGQEPMIIAYLVQTAIQQLVLRELTAAIDSHPTDLTFLERCKSIVHDFGPTPDIRPAIGAELVSGRIAVHMLAHQSGEQIFGDSSSKVTALARFGPARSVYEWRYVQLMHQLYKDLGQNPNSFLAMYKVFQGVDAKLDHNADWSYGLAEIMAPTFGGMAHALGEIQARKNVTLCGIDLLEAKQRTGSYPPKLPDSKGQWLDPFTEKPLLYHPSPAGFLIYSVGPDGKDNGGKPRNPNKSDAPYDIPFKFP